MSPDESDQCQEASGEVHGRESLGRSLDETCLRICISIASGTQLLFCLQVRGPRYNSGGEGRRCKANANKRRTSFGKCRAPAIRSDKAGIAVSRRGEDRGETPFVLKRPSTVGPNEAQTRLYSPFSNNLYRLVQPWTRAWELRYRELDRDAFALCQRKRLNKMPACFLENLGGSVSSRFVPYSPYFSIFSC